MKKRNRNQWIAFVLFLSVNLFAQEKEIQFVYGDKLPDAPVLSARGTLQIGVQTLELINPNQIDILNSTKYSEVVYDRPLTVEVWYPAKLAEGEIEQDVYEEVMGNYNDPKRPLVPFKFTGRAKRNALPLQTESPYPLIIVSHGYTGSRYLMTYLTENLASKGYVVVSIGHTDSTFKDASPFISTLLNRSLDDLFVLNEMDRLSKDSDSFLYELLDADTTGLVGYSMGGYGALNVGGAGYSQKAVDFFKGLSRGRSDLERRMMGNAEYEASFDSRIKAIVAMAPWGMENGVWDEQGLSGLKIPTFFIAGSKDDISGYEKGIQAIYEGTINTERYLLTYVNARHNIAPNPPPFEALQEGLDLNEYLRYADSVWDQRRMNNINQHFITAFLGSKLKSSMDYLNYLDANSFSDEKPWEGFLTRTSIGLELYYEKGN
jgi:predicted dienelactone hydrolase